MLVASRLILYLVSLTCAASVCPPDAQYDIIYAVDSDGRTGEKNYAAFYKFISESMEDFQVGANQTRVSVVTPDTQTPTALALTGDLELIKKELRRIEYNYNTAKPVSCLKLAEGVYNGAHRDNVKTVVVFETDGTDKRTKRLTINAANRLKAKGLDVFVLGFMPRIDHQELVDMATNPKFFFEANDYSDYKKFVHMLANSLCKDNPKTDTEEEHKQDDEYNEPKQEDEYQGQRQNREAQ